MSQRLYIDHGWRMPSGLMDSKERDPLSFSRAEWQQAKRASLDPRALKAMFQECRAASDSPKAFAQALAVRGFHLARGDRREYVAVDFRCEVYAVARLLGVCSKDLKAKLPDPRELPSVSQMKIEVAERMTGLLGRHIDEVNVAFADRIRPLEARRARMVKQQREARSDLKSGQTARTIEETRQRSQRLSRGLRAVWDWITRRTARIHKENESEAMQSIVRDQSERQSLIDAQLAERRRLQQEIRQVRHVHTSEIASLNEEIAAFRNLDAPEDNMGPSGDLKRKRRLRPGPAL